MARSRGFTLIEVMIASVILFASLVAITETYRTNVESSRRAEAVIRMATPLVLIVSEIRESLREDPLDRRSGSGNLMGVSFRFEADISQFASALPAPDPEGATLDLPPKRFRLYDVRLTLTVPGIAEREFLYQELVWLPVTV